MISTGLMRSSGTLYAAGVLAFVAAPVALGLLVGLAVAVPILGVIVIRLFQRTLPEGQP